MNRQVNMPALLWGLSLIALGVLFLLDRFRILDLHHLAHLYWPMIIVVIGAAKLLRRNLWGGSWVVLVGVWLQIAHLRLFGLTFNNSWPLLLIAFGAGVIARTLYQSVTGNAAQ